MLLRYPRLLGALAWLVTASALAHGGGLDDRGCHRDTGAGNYHCHQGPHAGETFSSKAAYGRTGSAGEGQSPKNAEYDRDAYHSDWRDRDGDCQDTREEVLIAESVEPVAFETERRCNVVAGEWHDRYSGEVFTDPSELDIDHLVPLKEAHRSGAAAWPRSRKHRYANDLRHPHTLIAVDLSENRSKGSRGPAEWLPSNDDFHCEYLRRWMSVKARWDLGMDAAEKAAIERGLQGCPGN